MKNLIGFFLKRKLLVNLVVVMVCLTGFMVMTSIQKEGIPKVDIMMMYISTVYPGASPSDVELNVTMRIEDAVVNIEGVKRVSSVSQEGLSQVVVELDPDLSKQEADETKRDIEKAIDRIVGLPVDILDKPFILEIATDIYPIIEICLQGDNEDVLRQLTDRLETKLRRTSGVSNISLVGYREKELRVELDPNKLIETETSVTDILTAINANNIRISGGTLESSPKEKSIVAVEELRTPTQVGNVIIRSNYTGNTLKVKDVAKVVKEYEDQSLIVHSSGKTSISLCVHKKDKADILKTISNVKKTIESEKKTWPDGINYELVNDLSKYTRNRLAMVTSNGVTGMILVFIVIIIFLDLRTAIWTAFGIPFMFFLAFSLFPSLGISINALSLGGLVLVLGMLVDAAIIVAESIHKAKEKGDATLEDIQEAVHDIVFPVLFSVVTTILAFAPMLFIPGIMGKFMFAVPAVVIIMLTASFIESIFILPSHLDDSSKKKKVKIVPKRQFMVRLENIYRLVLSKVLKKKALFLISVIGLFVFTMIYAVKNIPFVFASTEGATEIYLRLHSPIGTSLKDMENLTKKVEDIVAQLPKEELDSFSTRIGYDDFIYWNDLGTDDNYAVLYIYLTPYQDRTRTADDIINHLKKQIDDAGLMNVFEYVKVELGRNGPSTGKGIQVKLLSNNEEQLKLAAVEMMDFIKSIKGAYDVDDDREPGKEELKLVLDYEQMAKLGLNTGSLASTLRTAYAGTKISSIREGNDEVDLILKLAPQFRKDINPLLNLPVRNFAGQQIRINKFAKIDPQVSVKTISRYDRMRSIEVSGEVDNNQNTPIKVNAQIKNFALDKLAVKYPDIDFDFAGAGQALQDSMADLAKLFIIAVVGIYFVLVIAFGSFLQPILIIMAIPLSAIAVVWAIKFHGLPISFQAMVGFIGLAGVVVNNSLVMIDQVNKLRANSQSGCVSCVIDGAVTRLRPIILTTVTTVIGVVPLIYGWGGYDEFLQPMALSLGYGLLGATVLTLFVVPCLIVIVEGSKEKRAIKREARQIKKR